MISPAHCTQHTTNFGLPHANSNNTHFRREQYKGHRSSMNAQNCTDRSFQQEISRLLASTIGNSLCKLSAKLSAWVQKLPMSDVKKETDVMSLQTCLQFSGGCAAQLEGFLVVHQSLIQCANSSATTRCMVGWQTVQASE